MVRGNMLRDRLAALTAALLLVAPGARAAEPSPAAPAEESGPSFSDRFFRGTSPGELPAGKLVLVAGLYVGAATSVGVGIASLLGAGSKSDDAERFKQSQAPGFCSDLASPSCARYRHFLSQERGRRETGLMFLGVGGLLALGGGLTAELWHNDATPALAVTLTPDELSLGFRARF